MEFNQLPQAIMTAEQAAQLPSSYDFTPVQPVAEIALSKSVEGISFSVAHYKDLGKEAAKAGSLAYVFAQPTRVESLGSYMAAQAHHQLEVERSLAPIVAETKESVETPSRKRVAAAEGIGSRLVGAILGNNQPVRRPASVFAFS